MPQGIAPVAPIHHNRHVTWLRRARLDEQIARGAGVEGDGRLALRAEQLTSRDERDRVARGLERMLEAADHAAEARSARGAPVLSIRVPLRVREIHDCAADFDALLARLRDDNAIDARGVAMTRRLLSNGASPLYYRRSPFTLRHAVRSARLGLEPVAAPVEVEVPLAA